MSKTAPTTLHVIVKSGTVQNRAHLFVLDQLVRPNDALVSTLALEANHGKHRAQFENITTDGQTTTLVKIVIVRSIKPSRYARQLYKIIHALALELGVTQEMTTLELDKRMGPMSLDQFDAMLKSNESAEKKSMKEKARIDRYMRNHPRTRPTRSFVA